MSRIDAPTPHGKCGSSETVANRLCNPEMRNDFQDGQIYATCTPITKPSVKHLLTKKMNEELRISLVCKV